METTDWGFRLVYHQTCVVERRGNTFILNSGGYRTATTKKRMNTVLPTGVYVFQKEGVWYTRIDDTTVVPFRDGISIEIDPIYGDPPVVSYK